MVSKRKRGGGDSPRPLSGEITKRETDKSENMIPYDNDGFDKCQRPQNWKVILNSKLIDLTGSIFYSNVFEIHIGMPNFK